MQFSRKQAQYARLVIENESFGLVFAKTGSINSGTDLHEGNNESVHITSLKLGVAHKLN